MAPLKSPGSNNFIAQSYWHIVGAEVCSIVLKFLNKGEYDYKINFIYLVLIPKKNNPVHPSDFKPISLYNIIHKLV